MEQDRDEHGTGEDREAHERVRHGSTSAAEHDAAGLRKA